ncbi:MAG TPA: hypothetical protein VG871_09055 [Vicinamibacterales bacterium]|nr:hypothetical protein [Vicinamibacterales bacterium]
MRALTVALCLALTSFAGAARAQQTHAFSIETGGEGGASTRAPLAMFAGKQLDPMSGVEAAFGRITVVALEDSRVVRGDGRQSRQAEWFAEVWHSRAGARVAVGSGVRRESTGANVALTRVVAEAPMLAGALVGNVALERPFAAGRDPLDVITTVAYSRRIGAVVSIGAEGLLQDVEGFWNPLEAEGGARLFLGPSVDLALPAEGWRLHVTGGRDMRASSGSGGSDAYRALGRSGAVVRVSASHGF